MHETVGDISVEKIIFIYVLFLFFFSVKYTRRKIRQCMIIIDVGIQNLPYANKKYLFDV